MEVRFKRMRHDARAPEFAKPGDACVDLRACDESDAVAVWPDQCVTVYTGIAIELPPGYEAQVRGRSGLASKGIMVALGTIDSGYRGNIGVVLHNTTRVAFAVRRGDRIAQLAIRRTEQVEFVEADELAVSARGDTGFGSSGMH